MNKLKTLRIKAGFNIKTAAFLLAITPSALYKIESGQRKPNPILKLKMAELYRCHTDDISNYD